MSGGRKVWALATAALVALVLSLGGYACYQMGYAGGQEEGRRANQLAREAAAGKTLTDELDLCNHALQSITRSPKAFTAGDRAYWRSQTKFLIDIIERGLLPKLAAGEKLEVAGGKLSEDRVRRLVEQGRELLDKLPS